MKVPTGLDAGLGQILPDATPVKQQTLTVPEGAFGGVRAKQLSSLATGVQGIGSIIDAERRKSQAEDAAAEARELTQRAQRQRADEIAAEQAEEDFENGLAAAAKAMPAPGVAGAGDKYREIDKALPRLAMGALGPLPPEERRKLAPYIASRTDMARAHLVQQQQAYTEAGAQAARQAKLKRGLESVIAADGGAFEMAQAEALIDDVARREAVDQGWSDAETNAYRLAEERKLSTAVFDSLLARGNAVAAELFKESMAEGIWDEATRQKKDGLLLKSLERENAADTIGALLERMPDHAAALAEAKRINNKQVKALVLEALEVRNTLEARTAFDARARGFVDLYTTLGDAGGDLGAVTEAQWQAQDGPGAGDGKGKPRGEAKAARKLAKKLRQGTPVETDWGLYYRLSNLPPKELAEVPIWDHAEKLNRSEFLLLAERQQQTRAALATGAPFSAAGAPGSLDAQLAALATRMGWDSAAQAETRGLIEREIRAEIAEAAAANGGKPLAIAQRRKLINEAATELATVVAPSPGADDTLIGGAGDDTLEGGRFGRVPGANPNIQQAGHLARSGSGADVPLPVLPPATPEDIQEAARQMNESVQKISEWFGSIGVAAPNEAEDGEEEKADNSPAADGEPGRPKPPGSGLGPVVAAEAAREIAREVVLGGEDAEEDTPDVPLPDIKDPVTQKIVDAAASGLGDPRSGTRAIEYDEVNLGNEPRKVLRSLVNATVEGPLPSAEGEGTQVNFPLEGRVRAKFERELGNQADLPGVDRVSFNSANVRRAVAPQPEAGENHPRRYAISGEDISRVFEVMNDFDGLVLGKGPEQTFTFEKRSSENRALILQMKIQEDGTLAFQDMWKIDPWVAHRPEGEKAPPPPKPRAPNGSVVNTIVEAARIEARRDPDNEKRVTLRSVDIAPGIDHRDLVVALAEAQRSGNLRSEIGRDMVVEFFGLPVSELAAKKALEFGKDITGRSHTMSLQNISHAFNSHGPENETDVNNEPISVEDFAMVPDVLRNPDVVVFYEEYEGKGASLEYRRRINGWLVAIQMITGEGSELNELQFRTLRKEKRKGH